MPYIKHEGRSRLSPRIAVTDLTAPGDLNYAMHELIAGYMAMNGMSYQTCNDVLGVLSAISHEYYRRLVASYEDRKIAENGDVSCYLGRA